MQIKDSTLISTLQQFKIFKTTYLRLLATFDLLTKMFSLKQAVVVENQIYLPINE